MPPAEPIVRPPYAFPLPSDPAWLNPATVREIAGLVPGDVWDGGWTDIAYTEAHPSRTDLLAVYGTYDPDKLRRMFALPEDIEVAERYAAQARRVAA